MFKRRFLLIVFVSGLITAFSTQAVLPVLVWAIARQAAVYTAESVAIGVIARGFAANDPYVRTTATISRARLAQNMASSLRGVPWAGLAALTAALTVAYPGEELGYDEDLGLVFIDRFSSYTGRCSGGEVMTIPACYTASFGGMLPQSVTLGPFQWPDGQSYLMLCYYGANPDRSCGGNISAFYLIDSTSDVIKKPLTADQINSGFAALASSPNTLGDMFAGANPDMLNKLLDGATIPYNATNPTPEMAQLKSDYRNGLLQSVDPNAAHYVTPELMKQIQDLVAAEDAANTDDGTIEALNEKMKQPITQAQYEESNLKTETAQAGSLEASLGAAFEPIAQLKQDNDFILDKMTSPPEPPSGIDFFKWTLPTGSCSGFAVDMSVGNGKLHTTKQVNEFCPFYDSVAHPLLFWFLNIATFLYLFWLWDRSVSDMAR